MPPEGLGGGYCSCHKPVPWCKCVSKMLVPGEYALVTLYNFLDNFNTMQLLKSAEGRGSGF